MKEKRVNKVIEISDLNAAKTKNLHNLSTP